MGGMLNHHNRPVFAGRKRDSLTLMPPIRCSPLNSFPFFSQWMVGAGFPAAAQRNLTVLAAGTANSFLSIRSGRVQ